MKLTSALKEHTWSYKGVAEENITELGSKNETHEADFSVSPLSKNNGVQPAYMRECTHICKLHTTLHFRSETHLL